MQKVSRKDNRKDANTIKNGGGRVCQQHPTSYPIRYEVRYKGQYNTSSEALLPDSYGLEDMPCAGMFTNKRKMQESRAINGEDWTLLRLKEENMRLKEQLVEKELN